LGLRWGFETTSKYTRAPESANRQASAIRVGWDDFICEVPLLLTP
jgi:hypothetical protein